MRPSLILAALSMALGASCSLPSSGPTTAEVTNASQQPDAPYILVELTAAVIEALAATDFDSGLSAFAQDGEALGQRIAIGDLVQVTLFEPTGGGLFGSGDVASGAAAQALPAQAVTAGGTVRVPFAGDVPVVGLDPADAAARIEAGLTGLAIEPQALVVIESSAMRSVAVLGDAVAGGGRVPLTGGGERLLDVLAAAGGINKPLSETIIRLSRDGRSLLAGADSVLAEPRQNVPVRPRDVIVVEHKPRRFSVLGAANENNLMPFGQSRLTLADALGRAGGLTDARADPSGVFLARYESASKLGALPGVSEDQIGRFAASGAPVIYQLDLARGESLLLAQRFSLRDGDVLYVSNSTATPYEKLFRMVGLVLAPLNTLLVIDRLSE